MAKSPKSKSTKDKVEDAVELDVETSEAEEIMTDADEVVEAEFSEDDLDDVLSGEDENLDDFLSDDDLSEDITPEDIEEIIDPAIDDVVDPAPVSAEPQKSSSFVPLLLGGVVAGAIGYGVATYFQPEDMSAALTAKIDEQAEQITSLTERLDNLPAPDTSAIEAEVADISTQLSDGFGALADIGARLEVVERQPNTDGTLSETALAAYQAELDALRGELDAQQNAVMTAASQAEEDLATARAQAERLEQEALAAAEAASARAAINRIATAIDTGAPFADALADLGVEDVPAALTAAAEAGVTTNAQLTDDFPAAARAALSTARAEGLTDDTGGIGGFLRSQLDVRSSTPQEGDGPDAVLSRAEAAVKEGRVGDALAEIEALPEVARAEITDWTAQAQERADVLDAIATLSETYQ